MDRFEERLVIAEQRIASLQAGVTEARAERTKENAYMNERIRELEKTVWRGVGIITAVVTLVGFASRLIK